LSTLLIDGHNIALRSLFAMSKAKPLSTEDGIPTGALHTCIITMASYIKRIQPDRVMVCWDSGGSSWRSEVFPEYKAERSHSSDPSDYITKLILFLDLAGVPQIAMAHLEADDLIASYWNHENSDSMLHILSGDKDFYQLLDQWTIIHHPGDKEPWTDVRFENEFGFKPDNMRLVMALMGDKIDGIPGVPGVGMKTAVKILDSVYANEQQLIHLESFGKIKIPPGVVKRNLSLVDLTKIFLTGLPTLNQFSPTVPGGQGWDELVAFLDRLELHVVKGRLMAHRLWTEAGWSPKKPQVEGHEKGDRLWAY
jgi:5'-3' exonuclease